MLTETKIADAFRDTFGIDPRQHAGTFSLECVRDFANRLGLQYAEDITKANPGRMPTEEERERNRLFLKQWVPGFVKAITQPGKVEQLLGHVRLNEAEATAYTGPVESLPPLEQPKPDFAATLREYFVAETKRIANAYNSTRRCKGDPAFNGEELGHKMADVALEIIGDRHLARVNASVMVNCLMDALSSNMGNAYHYVDNWQGTKAWAVRVFNGFREHWAEVTNAVR